MPIRCFGLNRERFGAALAAGFAEPARPTVLDVVVTRDPAHMLPAVDNRTVGSGRAAGSRNPRARRRTAQALLASRGLDPREAGLSFAAAAAISGSGFCAAADCARFCSIVVPAGAPSHGTN
jgi:hypothetical protein